IPSVYHGSNSRISRCILPTLSVRREILDAAKEHLRWYASQAHGIHHRRAAACSKAPSVHELTRSESCRQALGGRAGLIQAAGAGGLAEREPFGVHELDVF